MRAQHINLSQISLPRPAKNQRTALDSDNIANDVQASIDRMLAQTQALKPTYQEGPVSSSYTRKRGLKDINVIAKVKTVFNDRIQARNAKKREDGRLLDEPTSIAEIRLNEGRLLQLNFTYTN